MRLTGCGKIDNLQQVCQGIFEDSLTILFSALTGWMRDLGRVFFTSGLRSEVVVGKVNNAIQKTSDFFSKFPHLFNNW